MPSPAPQGTLDMLTTLGPLHRPRQKGGRHAEWKQSETGPAAKFYSLAAAGRRRHAGALNLIFEEHSR